MPQDTPTKPLPDSIFTPGGDKPAPEIPPPHPADTQEGLVNENPKDTIARLTKNLELVSGKLKKVQAKYDEERVQRAGYASGSQKFRLYLALIQGMAQNGTFDPANFKGKPNADQIIRAHMDHAVGLAQVAFAAKGDRLD